MLDLYGHQQWWSGLGEAGGDNVVILPGVSLAEAQEFVDLLYGRQKVTTIVIVLMSNLSPTRFMTK